MRKEVPRDGQNRRRTALSKEFLRIQYRPLGFLQSPVKQSKSIERKKRSDQGFVFGFLDINQTLFFYLLVFEVVRSPSGQIICLLRGWLCAHGNAN